MNKRIEHKVIAITILLLSGIFTSQARTRQESMALRHEVRIGWGDQLTDQIIWHDEVPLIMSAGSLATYKQDYTYTQHWWGSYRYHLSHWFSAGVLVDGSGVHWDNVTCNGSRQEVSRTHDGRLYNLAILPEASFTYLHTRYVEFYSGLGIGLNINGGSEVDEKGRHTVVAPVFDMRLLGVKGTYGPWSCAADLGGMIAMKDFDHIQMVMSRMITISMGYSFDMQSEIQRIRNLIKR